MNLPWYVLPFLTNSLISTLNWFFLNGLAVSLTFNERIKESAPSSVHFGADTSQLTFDNAVKAILLYLGWVVVILPSARSASNHLGFASCPCLGGIDSDVKLAVVKFIIGHLFAAISECHGDWTHAKRIHLMCPYNFSFGPNEFLDVIWVGNHDVLPLVAVPQERSFDLS